MIRVAYEDVAAQRARWLAELAEALEEAQRLTRELQRNGSAEALALSAQIDLASREAEELRLRRSSPGVRENIDPEWTDNLPWRRSA